PAPPRAAKPAATATAGPKGEKPVLLGRITRQQVETAVPEWVQTEVESTPDRAAEQSLATVAPQAEVTVYLGTWCSDSRREGSRLWRVLDDLGGTVPFEISYIGVDREKKEPADLVAGSGLRFVPTLIVRRGGREVGRIVESSPHGVEQDLLALLTGSAQGLVTGKEELLQGQKP